MHFDQDLIYSKIPPKEYNKNTFYKAEDDYRNHKTSSGFELYLNEIINGGLNHDLLQILQECSSNQEKKEIYNKLKIDALIFYPKSMMCNDYSEWKDKCDEHNMKYNKNVFPFNPDYTVTDTRPRYWIPVPMNNNWMEKLMSLRKEYPKGTPINHMYKSIINSTYGSLASSFFEVSNVCVANNITARARAFAWCMAKALGIYQTITDGGVFDINNVNFKATDKKPSLHTLTHVNERDYLDTNAAKRYKTGRLDNSEWKIEDYTESMKTEIADKALKHVKDYFEDLKIDVLDQFTFEVKHIIEEASFQAQSNQRLIKIDDPKEKEEIKARGYNIDKPLYIANKSGTINLIDELLYNDEGKVIDKHKSPIEYGYNGEEPPVLDCLIKISNNEPIPFYPNLKREEVLKIKVWKAKNNKNVLPGSTVSKNTRFKAFNLSMFKWRTQSQYKRYKDYHYKSYKENNIGIEKYYRNNDGMLEYMNAVRIIQKHIYNQAYGKKKHTRKNK